MKKTYTRLRTGQIIDDVIRARRGLAGPTREALRDFDMEEWEEAAGTYFVTVWVANKTQAAKITAAFKTACTKSGHTMTPCARFGEFEPDDDGEHDGRSMISFFIAAKDFSFRMVAA